MGDAESDEHLRIFKCLIDTGSHVLRNAIGIKVLNNNSNIFVQYLENNKHQFYHQFEKNISRKCCLGSPHGCNFNGIMDKKIFYKMYNKTAEQNTQDCLDRFEIKAGISLDILDLSDLNFFLWNSGKLSTQEKHSLMKIMSIRSAICHPSSSHSYSINELEGYWNDLKSAVLLFAEPKCYKDIVEMQMETLQNCRLNVVESAKIIHKMRKESDKILHAIQQDTTLEKLVKDGNYELENCVRSENNKTKSSINNTLQGFKENIEKHHQVLTRKCTEEIQTTVTRESSNTRLHSEDQRRAIDTKLTESENRVCQTVIQSRGHLEDKIIEQKNETRKHTVELNADLMEEYRKLTAEVMEMKTILIGYVGKKKVDLVMNTEETEKSTKSPDKRKVDITVKINQTHVTEDKENKIIENLPNEIEILTNNDSSPEAAVTEIIEITGKKVNSIILELKATPGIFHSEETFRAAMLTLVQNIQTAGGIDVDIEETVTVNLRFESPLTEDQFAVVKCLFAKEWNDDNNTKQQSTEYSPISDEYSSTSDKYSSTSDEYLSTKQKETSEVFQPETTEPLTKTLCQFCDDKDKIIMALKEQNEKRETVNKRNLLNQQEEYRNLRDSLRRNPIDDTYSISVKEILSSRTQKELDSDDFIILKSEQRYDSSSKSTLYECRNCYEKNEIIIQLDRRLCEIRRRIIEGKGQSLFGNNFFEDLLKLTNLNIGFMSDEVEGRVKDKELQSAISSLKSELIYDSDVGILDAKAAMKSIKLQPRQFLGGGSDKPQDQCDFRSRILELRRELAVNSYTKKEGQKGLAIIVYPDDRGYISHLIDSKISQLGDFFEEMRFIVKRVDENNYRQRAKDIHGEDFYCVFLVITDCMKYNAHGITHLLRSSSEGKPMIVMTDYIRRSYEIDNITDFSDTLVVLPFRPYGEYFDTLRKTEQNMFDLFMKVTRCNRFADIMDILTKMNQTYGHRVLLFKSTLRKKFCFL